MAQAPQDLSLVMARVDRALLTSDPERFTRLGSETSKKSLSSAGPTTAASKQRLEALAALLLRALQGLLVLEQPDEDPGRRIRVVEGPEQTLSPRLEQLGDPSDRRRRRPGARTPSPR